MSFWTETRDKITANLQRQITGIVDADTIPTAPPATSTDASSPAKKKPITQQAWFPLAAIAVVIVVAFFVLKKKG